MATECSDHHHDLHHQSYLNAGTSSWSFPEFPLNNQQDDSEAVPLSEILDTGSISFGRYSAEMLAWEKWSVFSHNRCQEELEKFTNPGFVARKKAYFEQYYKTIRAMKALEAEQQEIIQPDACEEAQISETQMECGADSVAQKEEIIVNSIPISDSNVTSNLDSSSGGPVQSEEATEGHESYANDFDFKAVLEDKRSVSLPSCEANSSITKVSELSKPSSSRLKGLQKNKLISSTVNRKENQLRKHTPVRQEKGTVAATKNKTKIERSRTMNTAVKQSGSALLRKLSSGTDNCLLTSKRSEPKEASKISRKAGEVCPSSTVSKSLLTKDKLESSMSSIRTRQLKPSAIHPCFSGKLPSRLPVKAQSSKLTSSSIRAQQLKPSTSSQGMARKLPTRLPVHCQSVRQRLSSLNIKAQQLKRSTNSQGMTRKLPNRLPVHGQSAKQKSSSLNIRAQQVKRSTTSQGLAGKLPTRLPVHAHSAETISKDINEAGGLENTALAKRSEDLSTQSRSNHNVGVEIGQKTYVKGGKEKEENRKKNSALARGLKAASASELQSDQKSVSSIVSNSPKASNAKLVHKSIAP